MGNLKHLYRNESNKACFPHDVEYSDCKELAKRIISDNILRDKVYEIERNCGYDRYQRELRNMVYRCLENRIGSECE